MGTTNVRGAGPWALLAICMGYFMVILDTTIVNAALPALRADLGADVTGLQWVVDGYMLVLAAGLLSGGALADLLGARRVCQWGLVAFVVASIACGAAPNLPVLIAARILQGVGAALAVPASLALLRAANPDRQARARAVGIWGGVAGGAAAAGPILGGLLVGLVGWESVFLVNVPIGLAACWLIARTVPAPEPRPRGLDLVGQVLAALALTALTVALIEHTHVGVAVVSAAVFLVAGVAFVLAQRRAKDPMLPLSLFRDATLSAGTAVGLLINLGFYGELFVLNLYLQEPRHLSALVAGLALLPQMGMAAIGSALSGRYTAATGGPRRTMLVGLLIGAAGLLGLMIAGEHTAYLWLVLPLVATGFGMSFTMPAATTAVTDAAPDDRAGLAAGVINAARQLGSVLGVAILGGLAGHGAGLVPGMRVALAVAGAAFLLAAVLTAVGVRHHAEDSLHA
ncbi:MFS transporter [Labedaea rhizosphaerae]|uniref:DHA2 family methylenomycin A resistance protein-like MFS transporter n=1 Tax=Labedaea rhizosphaerae TaxID=598644 RepID=A0A4R6SI96_LABRH|nr:MFS transporter [Labedaea rhizosphaerae]TDQ01555.1 DHA2 family methylenomycin A resistance protein-like MFS transporter [Labedaea rhizosphaerae]